MLLIASNLGAKGILFVDSNFRSNDVWTRFSRSDELNVKNLIQLLAKSPTGKSLLFKAKNLAAKQGKTLMDVIKVGEGSYTDTTLLRRFSARNPANVSYESRSTIFINKDHIQFDALLDLAHELTHYVERPDFDPYAENFSLEGFISSTIEGQGGEAQAFVTECKVLKELFSSQIEKHEHCSKIYRPDSADFDHATAVRSFYKVGRHWQRLKSLLEGFGVVEKLPYLSDKKEAFISSVYGEPYPLAAYREYMNVMTKVCENDLRRLGYLKNSNERSPASIEMTQSFEKRCSDFL